MIIYLNSPWFELTKSGKKIYEGRRHTELIDKIKIGEIIEIKHYIYRDLESFHVEIIDKLYFQTFEEALTKLNINEVLPIKNIDINKGIEIYKQYVSIKTQELDGICMLKIKLTNK
jgi:ASC-1-like (ASCH) protein